MAGSTSAVVVVGLVVLVIWADPNITFAADAGAFLSKIRVQQALRGALTLRLVKLRGRRRCYRCGPIGCTAVGCTAVGCAAVGCAAGTKQLHQRGLGNAIFIGQGKIARANAGASTLLRG